MKGIFDIGLSYKYVANIFAATIDFVMMNNDCVIYFVIQYHHCLWKE